ncbi:MAG: exonuclease domain-containing protein [Chloroflexota bacterium]
MDHLEPSADHQPRYAELVERAIGYVHECGGAVHEDMLVAFVFGSAGSPKLWTELLNSILGGDSRLRKTPDGSWIIPDNHAATSEEAEFVVVDVETTGLKPRHHRITEVAILGVGGDGSVFKWSTLVNPDRQIPAQVSRLTGIRNQDVASAPLFRSIAQTVIDIVGNRTIIGHNVEFDVSFINAELQRCGLPRLVNATLDTMSLANVMIPELKRLSLSSIAAALDVDHVEAHRALTDAESTLSIFEALRERASDSGEIASFEALERIARQRRPARRHQHVIGRGRAILDDSLIDGVPHAPGVYIMRDRDDRVIYVGKAVNLRKRLSSYFSQPLGYTRKMDGLLESIVRIEIEVVGSELEALVLESQLIRRYRPRFNKQQRNAEQYTFIRVDLANPWPTITLSKDRKDDGSKYYGPFKSERHCRDVVQLLNDVLPLRTCKRSFRDARSLGNPCIELSLRRCAGPCVGRADPDEYLGAVNAVINFFDGDSTVVLDLLHERLAHASAMTDFERARRIRDQIRRLTILVRDHQRVQDLKRYPHALLVLPGVNNREREVWYLLQGQRWGQLTAGPESPSDLAERLQPIRDRALDGEKDVVDHHHTIDESSLIWRWLNQNPDHDGFIAWGGDDDALEVAERVLSARLTEDTAEERMPDAPHELTAELAGEHVHEQ